jgi:hypothetical protein
MAALSTIASSLVGCADAVVFGGDAHSLSRLLLQEINILFHGLPAELRA